jgi:mannose/fructose/N-acetylgalactosamine-specific phosphotransferase system component IID
VFVRGSRTTLREFVPALLTLLMLFVFYVYVVKGRTAQWCMLVLLFPACVMLVGRLRHMRQPAKHADGS